MKITFNRFSGTIKARVESPITDSLNNRVELSATIHPKFDRVVIQALEFKKTESLHVFFDTDNLEDLRNFGRFLFEAANYIESGKDIKYRPRHDREK